MASKFDNIAAMMGGGMPQQMAPGPAAGGGAGILQALQSMLQGGMSGAPDPRMAAELGPMLSRPRQMASTGVDMADGAMHGGPSAMEDLGASRVQPTPMDTVNASMQGPPQTDEEEIENVRKKMGAEGEEYVWEGDKKTGPTPNDIKYMKENPTDGVLEDFESYFGITPNANENTEEEEE